MLNWLRGTVSALLLIAVGAVIAHADIAGTDRDGNITIFGFTVGEKKLSATAIVDSTGTEKGTEANPTHVESTGYEDGSDVDAFASIGCPGLATAKTAVTATKMAQCVAERDGRIVVVPYALSGDLLRGNITSAMTSTTSTAVAGMGAQGGSLRVYVTACTTSNMDDTTATEVVLQDGSGGTVLWTIPAAINGGGGHTVFPTPIFTTANTGLYAANLTSGATTKISCTGYKAL